MRKKSIFYGIWTQFYWICLYFQEKFLVDLKIAKYLRQSWSVHSILISSDIRSRTRCVCRHIATWSNDCRTSLIWWTLFSKLNFFYAHDFRFLYTNFYVELMMGWLVIRNVKKKNYIIMMTELFLFKLLYTYLGSFCFFVLKSRNEKNQKIQFRDKFFRI